MDLAVLLPVKRFEHAKGRLAALLDEAARARLARWLATRVVGAVRPLPTFIACDDEGVATWADSEGAEVLWTPQLGLNGAVDGSRAMIAGKGFDHLVVAHSDLPLAAGLAAVAVPGTVTLVPDRHGDGTNVVAAPLDAPLRAVYGAGSFRAHLGQALAGPHPVSVRRDGALGLDVDTVADLTHPLIREELPAWLQTILAGDRR